MHSDGGTRLEDQLRELEEKGWSGAVRLYQPRGAGAIHLVAGRVVHAEYGRLSGEFAYWQLIDLPGAVVALDQEARSQRRSIVGRLPMPRPRWWRSAGRPPLPSPPPADSADAAAAAGAEPSAPTPSWAETAADFGAAPDRFAQRARTPRLAPPARRASASDASARRNPSAPRRAPRSPFEQTALATKLALAALSLLAGFALGTYRGAAADAGPEIRGEISAPIPAPVSSNGAEAEAVDVSELRGAGDSPPALIDSAWPESPDPQESPVQPIVLRLLVDGRGHVARALIQEPAPGRAAFERAALQVAQDYRFTPARSGGRPVSVWINLPVHFR